MGLSPVVRDRETAPAPPQPQGLSDSPDAVGPLNDSSEVLPSDDANRAHEAGHVDQLAAWQTGTDDYVRTGNVTPNRGRIELVGAPYVPVRSEDAPLGANLDQGITARAKRTGILSGDRVLLADNGRPRDPNIATDAPTGVQLPANGTQRAGTGGTGGTQGTSGPAPTVAVGPGAPIDVTRFDALNTRIQGFQRGRSNLDAATIQTVKTEFQTAADALHRGDYAGANAALSRIGFPMPTTGNMSTTMAGAAVMLGAARARSTGNGGWTLQGTVRTGARGNQALNDVQGFQANARMMERMTTNGRLPGHNPPTEAEATDFMRRLGTPNRAGQRTDPNSIMLASSVITNGSIMHYSSAGKPNPVYGANPNPKAFYKDRSGQTRVFDSVQDAQTAARTNPPARGSRITRMNATSPDEWSDISSQGQRSGRNIGDCESKLYMQTRLLTSAGFTSLGSIDVAHGNSGHMLGAFRSPDGRVFVTSNEDFREVTGTGTNGAVTQADLDQTVQDLTAELYHVTPNARTGVRDMSSFRFSSAPTLGQPGPDPAITSIRASTENSMMRRTQALIP